MSFLFIYLDKQVAEAKIVFGRDRSITPHDSFAINFSNSSHIQTNRQTESMAFREGESEDFCVWRDLSNSCQRKRHQCFQIIF
jgi:hypothetical protein